MHTLATAAQLRLAFGAAATGGCRWGADGAGDEFRVAVPVLDGPTSQVLLSARDSEAHVESWGRVRVFHDPSTGLVAGAAAIPAGSTPEAAAREIYSDLLEGIGGGSGSGSGGGGLSLYRAWNFIPDINRARDGLENYRAFNRGRWEAFADRFGESAMESQLPAASAVGVAGDEVAVVFLAGRDPVQHFENPRQIPAYHYPGEHGPRAPSFARGSVVEHTTGSRTVFLSGTSSIVGHETVGEGDLATQTETTLDNVDEMLRTMRVTEPAAGNWRVYLRHPSDLATVRASFFGHFPEAEGRTQFVHADICRSPLQLEIEAAFDLGSAVT